MSTKDDFLPDDAFDQLIAKAMRARPEAEPTFDLAHHAIRLAREQQRAELDQALQQSLRAWKVRSLWQWAASAVAAAIVLVILTVGFNRIHRTVAASAAATESTFPTTDEASTSDTITDTSSTTSASTAVSATSNGPLVLGVLAMIAAIAVLTVSRSFSRSDQQSAFATLQFA